MSESLADSPGCSTAPDEPDSGVDPDYPAMPMSPERSGPDAPLYGDAGAPADEDLTPAAAEDDAAGTVTLQG